MKISTKQQLNILRKISQRKKINDVELKQLLKEIDSKFIEIMPLLHKAGQALVEKAKKEKDVDLEYSIGWEEAGINTLCLSTDEAGTKTFKDFDDGDDWEEQSIHPLFRDLEILEYDSPYTF